MNELMTHAGHVVMTLTTEDLLNRVQRIREVQAKVMKEGVDYGTIQGCGDKPTLLKPGAETLLLAFEMAAVPDQLTIQDLGNDDEVRYRVVTPIVHVPTGRVCGHGVGECSSLEEKYKWRKAVCPEEFDEADPDRRRVKWAKSRDGGAYQINQVRTNKADVANTVLKMGKKRSLVDGALTVTAASRIFTQDIEDMPEEMHEKHTPSKQPLPSHEPLAPNYGPYAKQPLSNIPSDGLSDYLVGVERSIGDPKKVNFKAVNIKMRDAIMSEIAKREFTTPDAQAVGQDPPPVLTPEADQSASGQSTMTASNVQQQLRLCESIAEAVSVMNAWEAEEHNAEDRASVRIVFDQTKKRLQSKR